MAKLETHPQAHHPQQSIAGLFARLVWTIGGNLVALVCAVFILKEAGSGLSIWDLAYWAALALVVATRYLDVTRLGGTTSDDQTATLAHWRRSALAVVLAGLGVWGGVHIVALFV
jgi:hypothetical protein